ncbi:MAG TPA: phosphatidylglycerol lysyltransferase domain-containing protein [Candidatus Saccharimonadales bacterium]|nr:phosphatidylglycerol lysyltransferase domain-containing protein [Candidatus Saccharimonadales bacterium]
MSFPKFPEFRKLTVKDKHAYLHYYSQLNEPYSDFSFDNLIIWLDYHNDLEASDLNNNLVIRFTNILDDDATCYSLVGSSNISTAADSLLDFLTTHTDCVKLSYVPEEIIDTIRQLNRVDIRIEEDIDNKDYVYNTTDLAGMQGKHYRNLRERVIKFASGKSIHTKLFNCTDPLDRAIIDSAILIWSKKNMAHSNDPAKVELNAINKHLDLAQHFDIRAYGIYVENELACITIVHAPPHKGWLIGNHLKYDTDYPGAFGFTVHHLAIVAQSEGIQWLNCEQDLGKDGLKFIKTILRPAKFLQRYTVWLESAVKDQ